jgi:hypothetical protein
MKELRHRAARHRPARVSGSRNGGSVAGDFRLRRRHRPAEPGGGVEATGVKQLVLDHLFA